MVWFDVEPLADDWNLVFGLMVVATHYLYCNQIKEFVND